MAKILKITGMPNIIKNLKIVSAIKMVDIGLNMKKAGLFIQRESQKIVPIDTTHLKGTANTRNIGGAGPKTDIVVSFGSEAYTYAVYVHEDMDAKHKPGKRAKYLESVCREKKKEIFDIVVGKL